LHFQDFASSGVSVKCSTALRDGSGLFHQLKTRLSVIQIKTLCQMIGSQVLQSVSDTGTNHTILVPEMIDDELFHSEVFPALVENGIVPQSSKLQVDCRLPSYRGSRVKFVYFSWLTDTISADWLAPFRPYCLGFLE
jgi:hypothetical protein